MLEFTQGAWEESSPIWLEDSTHHPHGGQRHIPIKARRSKGETELVALVLADEDDPECAANSKLVTLAPKMYQACTRYDWKLLREQKNTLSNALEMAKESAGGYDDPEYAAWQLRGVLHAIDGIQDFAVDVLGVPADLVFGTTTATEE